MKYYTPIHLDGGNRGCEGIAKGTAVLLHESKENLVGLCTEIELDKKLNIDQYVTLVKKHRGSLLFNIANRVFYKIVGLFTKDEFILSYFERYYAYHPFIKRINHGDIMLSTGGDMMCYGDNQVITTCEDAKRHGVKTILWGCSMGESNLTKRKLKVLEQFDAIYARESLSYNFFISLGLKNVGCFPDPAFVLKPERVDLPVCFEHNKVIGINLTNYTLGAYDFETSFGQKVKKMIDYLLHETEYHILLIPHVLWEGQDDRIIARYVKDLYNKYRERITVLDSEKMNYLQIRYVISHCNIFIGGRTHAVISAYSTGVPTIALGYSIKSIGIAKDLGLPDYTVVNCKDLNSSNSPLEALIQLERDYGSIKKHLISFMPQYKARLEGVKDFVNKILE